MLLLKSNDRCRSVSSIPLRSNVAIFIGELLENNSWVPRQMRLRFHLPELEAFTLLNPSRGSTDIDDNELNRPRPEEAKDVLFGKRSESCGGPESIVPPQLSKGQACHDLECGVHVL